MKDFSVWMTAIQRDMETRLEGLLSGASVLPCRLHEAMRYSALGGGKRVRPLLVFAAGELSNAPESRLGAAASAVELIHVYSLIHDDLPSMDDDNLRRGRPSCHAAFDEATALLAGDALQSLAFQCLAEQGLFGETGLARQLRAISTLARASGSLGMAGGQAFDLDSVGKSLSQPELELMHAMKTGALIRAAARLGALCGDSLCGDSLSGANVQEDEENAFRRLDHAANRLGLLFQVVDDILDCTANSATLGKTAGKDKADDKPTYVSLLGLSEARRYAEELRQEARQTLAVFGKGAYRLTELTDFICDRRF